MGGKKELLLDERKGGFFTLAAAKSGREKETKVTTLFWGDHRSRGRKGLIEGGGSDASCALIMVGE